MSEEWEKCPSCSHKHEGDECPTIEGLQAELERERGLREAAERERNDWRSKYEYANENFSASFQAERGRAEVATRHSESTTATLRALEAALRERGCARFSETDLPCEQAPRLPFDRWCSVCRALAGEPAPRRHLIECTECDGSGLLDSGGFTPQGEPINIPCPGPRELLGEPAAQSPTLHGESSTATLDEGREAQHSG